MVAVAGGGDAMAWAKLDALHGDISGVISIGLAGALSPHLKVGDVVIADQIITGAEKWDCHEGWRVRLCRASPHAHQGPIFGSDVIILRPKTKSGLYDTTGALAVDMESQVAARFAAARNLPLAGLRVISDDAGHVLPPAALVAMKPDGGIASAGCWARCCRSRAGAGADPHGAGVEQGVRGTTPLPRSLWCWTCRP